MSWDYTIDTWLALERWIAPKQGSLQSFDLEQPHLGIYCGQSSHAGKPWLIGLFTISYEYLEVSGKAVWTFDQYYVSGDGHKLSLPNRTRADLLVGDRPHDFQADPKIMDDEARQHGRNRFSLECGACSYKSSFKSESLQKPVTALYAAGMREAPLAMLAEAVRRAK